MDAGEEREGKGESPVLARGYGGNDGEERTVERDAELRMEPRARLSFCLDCGTGDEKIDEFGRAWNTCEELLIWLEMFGFGDMEEAADGVRRFAGLRPPRVAIAAILCLANQDGVVQ